MRRPRQVRTLVTVCALALVSLAGHASAEVAEIPFGNLVVLADEILIGRVVEIVEVPVETTDEVDNDPKTVPLARVEVREWLKGAKRPSSVWVWGYGTWTCDVTWFRRGEEVLLFLDRDGVAELVTPPSLERLRTTTGNTSIRRVAWSGRGQMKITRVAGRPHASIWAGDLLLPSEVETLPGPDPRYATFRRHVALDDLRALLRRQIAALGRRRAGEEARVVSALGAMCDSWAEWDVAREQLKRAGTPGIAALWRELEDRDSPLHSPAAFALDPGVRGGEQRLLPALASKDVRRRRAAAVAFGWLSRGSPIWSDAVVAGLARAARDPDQEVRRHALRVLVRDQDDEALPHLLAGLADNAPEVRREAALALDPTWPFPSDAPAPHRASAEALLLMLGRDPRVRLRRAAWEILAACALPTSEKAALAALKDADVVVRVYAVCTLARFKSAESGRVLLASLGHADPWVRRAAAYALGTAKNEAALPHLIKALADKDDSVGALAAWALGELGPKAAAALPALREIVKRGGDSKRHYDAREALGAIDKK